MNLPEFTYQSHDRCDLHVHSIYSDGVHDADQLFTMANAQGLTAIALTDHHTVAGIDEFMFEGAKRGIYVIPAIEINAKQGDFLGYFIDHHNRQFKQFLTLLHQADAERLRQILSTLRVEGFPIDESELIKFSGPAFPRRSHIARFMLQKKHVKTIDQAFHEFLGKSSSSYIESLSPQADRCIDAIRLAGGVAVLAHPFYEFAGKNYNYIEERLHDYADLGIVGYEVYSNLDSSLTKIQDHICKIANVLGLLQVHGSNFHGITFSKRTLGAEYTTGDIIAKLMTQMNQRSLHRSFFKRMYWRSVNLDEDEFKDCLSPKEITLDDIKFTNLLEKTTPDPDSSHIRKGCPFILIHGNAIARLDEIKTVLSHAGYQIISLVKRDDYFEIAWTLYEMAKGNDDSKRRDLLKFNLDYVLFGELAHRCIILFMAPPPQFDFRKIKMSIRKTIGKIQFYRLNYNDVVDIHFNSFIHIPDEERVDRECAYLNQLGIDTP
ncbi:PHP domain-containing protein [candidate division KSB1 bacterium]|nr:PHP domain-containing protein [candidate division KSB1 bacterium]